MSLEFDAASVRAVRIAAQALPAPRSPAIVGQIERSGYQRTLGGADAYVAVRARVPALQRGDLEALVSEGELAVTPAVRGCIYVVPRSETPLLLRIAAGLSESRDARDAERAGIRPGELDEVGDAVLAELRASGPLTTDKLRRTLSADVVRSLGDQGKRVGVSSTLPPSLRRLEFAGRISRLPVDGRLDHEKYEWRVADGDPLAQAELPDDPTALHSLLLAGFLDSAGVTTLSAFCKWSGLTKRDAKAALAVTDHETVMAAGLGDDAIAPTTIAKLANQSEKARDAVAFLPFEDNLIHLAGTVSAWVRPEFQDLEVPAWSNMRDGRETTRLGDAKHVRWRSILAEGRICGFWDYEPVEQQVVLSLFDPPSRATQERIDDLAADVTRFLRDDIGHGLSFSIDTDETLIRRCELLRGLET
ncbi:MAG: winged helix DNA-binding domain-containing protein [bacterium]|nr:winged helix DNA-binding domain-containing protein [bacterium]